MLRARPAAETPYAARVASAATDGQLAFQTHAFSYVDPTGELPDSICLEVSAEGFTISSVFESPGDPTGEVGPALGRAVWGRTEFDVRKSADPGMMDLFLIM
jgi:hypothetical protein